MYLMSWAEQGGCSTLSILLASCNLGYNSDSLWSSLNSFCIFHAESSAILRCFQLYVRFLLNLSISVEYETVCALSLSTSIWGVTYSFIFYPDFTQLSYHHMRNDDVRWTTGQSHLSAIVQACRFSLFSHIAQMPDGTDEDYPAGPEIQ